MERTGVHDLQGDRPLLGRTIFLAFLAATAALGGMMFGFDLGIIVGAGPFLIRAFDLSDIGVGWAYSSLLFGCVGGALFAGRAADRFGRRAVLLCVAMLFLVTSVVTGLAPSFAVFILARLAGGFAVGGVSVVAPIYAAEIAPPRLRGRMGATYQLSITAGILLSYCINYGLRNSGDWNWRLMFISGALPSILFIFVLMRAPETPRYLFRVGRDREAIALLRRTLLAGEVEEEAGRIRHSFSSLPGEGKAYAGALTLTLVLAVLVHLSGIDSVIEYAPLMLRASGLRIDAALFSTFELGATNFLATLVSFWTIDRYGRRLLYMIGSAGMAISLVVGSFALRLGGHSQLLLASMMSFIIFFASCIGPAFWTVVPELLPTRRRGQLMMFPVITQWLANAAFVLVFPAGFAHIPRWLVLLFLSLMAVAQGLVAWQWLPETKGKTLEEIESDLQAPLPAALHRT